ncbi:RDD family protein [Lederbergia citrea]|uniref:RDD family protein n=1 Tax=Lederbergia citrea TaxID=2833581 RepID=A0A942UI66_9BACI|nr:RDD family protein [Lederbergia citrea]MBS4203396.1 RDD family protein [Lederbergia citrea]MBS4221931.1 RDD family protein [Lederbergia citrea]
MYEERTEIKTPEFVSLQFQVAGLGSRTAAYIIDQLILIVMNTLILIVLFFILIGRPTTQFLTEVTSLTIGITIIVLFIINWGYFFAFEYFSGGRTIGKKMIGIRVIQDNGHSITLLSSFIRNLLRIIDSLPAGYFVGMMMIFFHSQHKRVGDFVAGTIVVHERKEKKNNKSSALEKEIERREISKDDFIIESWTLQSLERKDWNLVNTYSQRFMQLPLPERKQLTKNVADIMLPKIGLETADKDDYDIENTLLVLYLNLREEWEFEL